MGTALKVYATIELLIFKLLLTSWLFVHQYTYLADLLPHITDNFLLFFCISPNSSHYDHLKRLSVGDEEDRIFVQTDQIKVRMLVGKLTVGAYLAGLVPAALVAS